MIFLQNCNNLISVEGGRWYLFEDPQCYLQPRHLRECSPNKRLQPAESPRSVQGDTEGYNFSHMTHWSLPPPLRNEGTFAT